MKKLLALAAVSALALMGCDSKDANAQASQTASVGNPDSANVLIIEEGYEVVAPASGSVNSASSNAQSPDWSQEGNVDVAPLPDNQQPAAPAGNNNNAASGNNGTSPAANAADSGTVNVDESITEMATPDAAAVEVDETVSD